MTNFRFGYMDAVDFDFELGAAAGGNTVFPSPDDLLKYALCAKHCGIVKVRVEKVEQILTGDDVSFSLDEMQQGSERYLEWQKEQAAHLEEKKQRLEAQLDSINRQLQCLLKQP